MNEFDMIIIGAGLSGIDAAVHLQKHCPGTRFVLLEARHEIGGTWSQFRYPGVRSDSDMHTLGYGFKPWLQENPIATGAQIQAYLRDTVREHDLLPKVRFRHRVVGAQWHSEQARWTLQVQAGEDPTPQTLRAKFLFFCGGYYDYTEAHAPHWPGMENFRGRVVHPQFWPQDLNWAGQRVLVIGSGATAVTLAPALAEQAAGVQLLQRSPSYLLSQPARPALDRLLRAVLGPRLAARLLRRRNAALATGLALASARWPQAVQGWLLKQVRTQLPPGYDVATHFTPRYRPWEQRLCLVPEGDFFRAIGDGRLEMVTDEIETFTREGVRLKSGRDLQADLVVSATGLKLKPLGGIAVQVDGRSVRGADLVNYKGVMYKDVPNLFATFGYTKASWTLKADLTSLYACRVLQHMAATGAQVCVPRAEGPLALKPFADLSSGYFERARHELPQQGELAPWALQRTWYGDVKVLKHAPVADGVLQFSAG